MAADRVPSGCPAISSLWAAIRAREESRLAVSRIIPGKEAQRRKKLIADF